MAKTIFQPLSLKFFQHCSWPKPLSITEKPHGAGLRPLGYPVFWPCQPFCEPRTLTLFSLPLATSHFPLPTSHLPLTTYHFPFSIQHLTFRSYTGSRCEFVCWPSAACKGGFVWRPLHFGSKAGDLPVHL